MLLLKILSRAVDKQESCHKIHAMWGNKHLQRSLEGLREDFGKLALRLQVLELSAPAVTASLLNASDKLARMAARAERTKRPVAAEGDEDDVELDEIWREVKGR